MLETKSPVQSLTIVSAAAAALATLLSLLGFQVDPGLISEGINTFLQIVALIGSLLAIVGRVRATKQISRDA